MARSTIEENKMEISNEQYQENIKRASDAAYLRGVEEGMSKGKAKKEWINGALVGAVAAAVVTAIIASIVLG